MKGKSGGKKPMLVSGNPNVLKEAKRKKGGAVEARAEGGKVVERASGGQVRPRLDRPGRKLGGRALANAAPLSTAHRASGGGVGSNERPLSTAHKGSK
jgi:hypothetical protein